MATNVRSAICWLQRFCWLGHQRGIGGRQPAIDLADDRIYRRTRTARNAVHRQAARFPAFDGALVAAEVARDRFPPVQSLICAIECHVTPIRIPSTLRLARVVAMPHPPGAAP